MFRRLTPIRKMQDQADVASLVEALSSENGGRVREAAAALTDLGTSDALAGLFSGLVKELWGGRPFPACDLLGQLGTEAATDELMRALEDPELRSWAAWSLGETGDPRAVAPLVKVVLEDPAARTRSNAIKALAHLGDKRAIQPAVSMLGDPDRNPRVAAAYALSVLSADDELLLSAKPISRKRMDLLWFDSRLGELESSVVGSGSTILEVVDDEGTFLRRQALDAADIEFAKPLARIISDAQVPFEQGNYQAAVASYRAALHLAPGCDLYLMSVGAAYGRMGEWARARAFLERAAEISPDNRRIAENLAQARSVKG